MNKLTKALLVLAMLVMGAIAVNPKIVRNGPHCIPGLSCHK